MMKRLIYIPVLFLFVVTEISVAQSVRKSQKGTVSQTVARTEITIEYNRPVARGRTLFGDNGIVKYGKIWMPGANEATFIELSDNVSVNGSLLEEGKYSIWAIPNQDEWEIIFSKDWQQWHSQYPGEDEDMLRVKAIPEKGAHMEVLAYYFPAVSPNSTQLRLHWGTTFIPLMITLQ